MFEAQWSEQRWASEIVSIIRDGNMSDATVVEVVEHALGRDQLVALEVALETRESELQAELLELLGESDDTNRYVAAHKERA